VSPKPTKGFEYSQHPHIEARKSQDPSQPDPFDSKPKTLNDRIGFAITKSVGTMWAAYVFIALTLVSLPAVIISGDPVLIIAWIAQTFLQLVLFQSSLLVKTSKQLQPRREQLLPTKMPLPF